MMKSTETLIDHGTGAGIVAGMISYEDYRDIKPEAFDARGNGAFLSEGWLAS